MAAYPQREESDIGSPSVDTSKRFSEDRWLRRHSFEIHSRKSGRVAIWKRNGKFYTHKEAMETVSREIASVEGKK